VSRVDPLHILGYDLLVDIPEDAEMFSELKQVVVRQGKPYEDANPHRHSERDAQ
jgi:hypothetical protein